MSHSFELTNKHCEVLGPLTSKVRVLTLDQIARTFFSQISDNQELTGTLVAELEEAGFLNSFSAMVHPEIELAAPLCRYSPGNPDPDFQQVARGTRGRWKRAPVSTEIAVATQQAKQEFGGYLGGKRPRASETRHDIHLAQIYLRLAMQDPAAAAAWVSEEQLRQERDGREGRLPDAIVRTDNPVIIEFGGAYPRAKLEAFHVEHKQQSYEIW